MLFFNSTRSTTWKTTEENSDKELDFSNTTKYHKEVEGLEELKKETDETTNLVTLLEQRYRVSVLIILVSVVWQY